MRKDNIYSILYCLGILYLFKDGCTVDRFEKVIYFLVPSLIQFFTIILILSNIPYIKNIDSFYITTLFINIYILFKVNDCVINDLSFNSFEYKIAFVKCIYEKKFIVKDIINFIEQILIIFITSMIFEFFYKNMARRRKREEEEFEEVEDNNEIKLPEGPHFKNLINNVADFTQPGLSIPFILLSLGIIYFHETHFEYIIIAIIPWLIIQFTSSVISDDFTESVFIFVLNLFGSIIKYIIPGFIWAVGFKMKIDARYSHLPTHLQEQFNNCNDPSCYLDVYYNLKYLLLKWTITWPYSIIYTAFRDVVRLSYDWMISMAENIGVYILQSAKVSTTLNQETSTASELGWFFILFLSYFLVGFIWTHAKLYWDVRYKSLPSKLDNIVVECYNKGEGFWNFVIAIKWLIIRWMVTWPFSFLSTILKNPIRILAERLYEFSQRKYAWITQKAMERRMVEE